MDATWLDCTVSPAACDITRPLIWLSTPGALLRLLVGPSTSTEPSTIASVNDRRPAAVPPPAHTSIPVAQLVGVFAGGQVKCAPPLEASSCAPLSSSSGLTPLRSTTLLAGTVTVPGPCTSIDASA